MKRWASLLLATAVSSCESACCRWVSVSQKLCTQDLYGSTISSFTGNHSVWLNSYCYRSISLDAQELYHLVSLIGVGIGQASFIFGQLLMEIIGQYHLNRERYSWKSLELLDEHYHRSLSLDEHYHRSLTGVINCYHCSRNKTYLENIQRYWINKLIYLMILTDEHCYLDEQCSWMSHLELTSHHSGQTLWWISVTRVRFRSWQCEFFERTKAPLGWTALILDVCKETTIETNLRNSFNTSYGVTNSRNINKPNNN